MKNQPVLERFFEKVNKDGPNGCWNFTSSISKSGHAKFFLNGKCREAHAVAYELLIGERPKGLELHHVCENPACVNPDHLKPLTRKEHCCLVHPQRLGYIHSHKTSCVNGHPLTEDNLVRLPWLTKGLRICLTCARRRTRESQAKRRKAEKNLTVKI